MAASVESEQKRETPGPLPEYNWKRTYRGLLTKSIILELMLQTRLISDLCKSISDDRFRPYLSRNMQDERAALADYAWNIALSESLYPSLHTLEVTPRNSIHNVVTHEFGDEYWFKSYVHQREQKVVAAASARLARFGRTLSPGNFVADLNFGFWVSLFDSRYDGLLWPKLLKPIFPTMPQRLRSYKNISYRMEKIRRLRNRAFHHEPVWYWLDLSQQHSEILETISWINPEMMRFVAIFDRFPEVYASGPQFYEGKLIQVFQASPDT